MDYRPTPYPAHSDQAGDPKLENGASAVRGTTPLVVKVPWKAPPKPVEPALSPTREPAPSAALLEPHSFLVDVGGSSVDMLDPWPTTPRSESRAAGLSHAAPSAPATGASSVSRRTISARRPQQTTISPSSSLGHSQCEQQGSTPTIHLRLDPPATAHEPTPHQQPLPLDEKSPWQQQLVAIDQFLRENRPAILLAVVVAVAGLSLLLFTSGREVADGPGAPLAPPAAGHEQTPIEPGELDPAPQLRPIDPPRVATALGPEGLAARHDLERSSDSETEITPIKPHFEHRADGKVDTQERGEAKTPYPTTDYPSWEGAHRQDRDDADDDSSNVAVIRSVNPTR